MYLHYGLRREIRFRPGHDAPTKLHALAGRYFDSAGLFRPEQLGRFTDFIDSARAIKGHEVRCYDDVMAFVAENQDEAHRQRIVAEALKHGMKSPSLHKIVKTDLYPYQKDGAIFAVTAGRCLIGDDMGLGKTVQALAASELMHRLFSISKVLIVTDGVR